MFTLHFFRALVNSLRAFYLFCNIALLTFVKKLALIWKKTSFIHSLQAHRKGFQQGGKRLGDETSSPLFKRCVMRRRTGTSALSALPVRLVAGKICLSTNRKSHFLSLFFSQPCTMIKTFFHSPSSQLTMLMSAWTLVNLFHSKFPKNALNLRVSNACSCRKT